MVRPVLVDGHGINEGPLAGKDLGEKFCIGRGEDQTGNQGTPPQQLTLLRKMALP